MSRVQTGLRAAYIVVTLPLILAAILATAALSDLWDGLLSLRLRLDRSRSPFQRRPRRRSAAA
jgi:hypothetical protein